MAIIILKRTKIIKLIKKVLIFGLNTILGFEEKKIKRKKIFI
jgi:hypothetical protein